jgi:hypothetical protein
MKLVARRAVHDTMAIPAHYYATPTSEPLLVNVRHHQKVAMVGDVKGTNFNYAERPEEATFLMFDRAEVASPARNALVFLSTGETYFIEFLEPPDGMTIKCRVVVARPDQIGPDMEAPPL